MEKLSHPRRLLHFFKQTIREFSRMYSWKECSWCHGRFQPASITNRFHRTGGPEHQGGKYCSPSCRQRAYRWRVKGSNGSSTVTQKSPVGTRVRSTVTRTKFPIEITEEFRAKNDHPTGPNRPLRTRDGEIVRDAKWPGMYRIRWRDGRVSDMVNYTRASAALRGFT